MPFALHPRPDPDPREALARRYTLFCLVSPRALDLLEQFHARGAEDGQVGSRRDGVRLRDDRRHWKRQRSRFTQGTPMIRSRLCPRLLILGNHSLKARLEPVNFGAEGRPFCSSRSVLGLRVGDEDGQGRRGRGEELGAEVPPALRGADALRRARPRVPRPGVDVECFGVGLVPRLVVLVGVVLLRRDLEAHHTMVAPQQLRFAPAAQLEQVGPLLVAREVRPRVQGAPVADDHGFGGHPRSLGSCMVLEAHLQLNEPRLP
mmetsp:Transcript_58711/g.132881  ORF Transcript_58711/g.132881 Transcript_58711/m.132881 type:complete len:261 (-) Transcript_58711:302-1084(-)